MGTEESAEIYWQRLLEKYGVEYSTDPDTGLERITCNRLLKHSIFDDEDYLSAISLADEAEQDHYEREAEKIYSVLEGISLDEIQGLEPEIDAAEEAETINESDCLSNFQKYYLEDVEYEDEIRAAVRTAESPAEAMEKILELAENKTPGAWRAAADSFNPGIPMPGVEKDMEMAVMFYEKAIAFDQRDYRSYEQLVKNAMNEGAENDVYNYAEALLSTCPAEKKDYYEGLYSEKALKKNWKKPMHWLFGNRD